MGFSTLFVLSNPLLALILFFVFITWQGLGEGIVVIAWQDMLAKLFKVDIRGRFFGVSGFGETLAAVIGASFAVYLLETCSFPSNFTILFFLAFIGLCIAWIFISLTKEPYIKVNSKKVSFTKYFSRLPGIIRSNNNF